MRNEFAKAVEDLGKEDDSVIFITGDLGYNALERLQSTLGKRFINAGVAEQNMVGVAAGFAHKGYKVFCYSIAPFVVYRCLEQFRNDVGFHNLPVFLVGNGGGYGYGIMGSSHHTLEDIACLSSLQNVKAWVPTFSDEVDPIIRAIHAENKPAYLRLGVGKTTPVGTIKSGTFQIVKHSSEAAISIVALGPIANNVLAALEQTNVEANVIVPQTYPFQLTDDVTHLIASTPNVLVVEEHVSIGGLGQQLSLQLLERGIHPQSFASLRAEGYPTGLYGSQQFHQQQSGIDVTSIAHKIVSTVSQHV